MHATKIKTERLNLHYGTFHALKDVSISIPENEITAFIGPSGCGKSTLLKTLNRMNDLVEGCRIDGRVLLDGTDIYADMDTNMLRKRVGMVFQKPNPFPMSVYDNIAYGPRTHGVKSKARLDDIVERSLTGAAIWDELKDRLKKSALALGRTAAAPLHRAGTRRRAGGAADGRADQRAGSDLHRQNRGFGAGTEKAVYHRHRDAQYAAGVPHQRSDRLLSARRGHRNVRYGSDKGEERIMRNRFDEQLELLNNSLISMGALCETAIADTIRALLTHDLRLAKEVIATDKEIDQKEKEIEALCLKLILHQQPVARDLRQISAALKMITDMERIGDQAADIAEIVTYTDLSESTNGSHIAFVRRDRTMAQSVVAYDDVVDDLFSSVKHDIMQMIAADPARGEQAVDILMISKYLERIGDHAVNIAEWVIFAITGKHENE